MIFAFIQPLGLTLTLTQLNIAWFSP